MELSQPFLCNKCGKRLSSKQRLIGHEQICTYKMDIWQCSICIKTFSNKFNLKVHTLRCSSNQANSLMADNNNGNAICNLPINKKDSSTSAGRVEDNNLYHFNYLDFVHKATVIEDCIADQLNYVNSLDFANNLSSIQTELNEQAEFDDNFSAFERNAIHKLTSLKDEIVNSRHSLTDVIIRRHEIILLDWEKLRSICVDRKNKLHVMETMYSQNIKHSTNSLQFGTRYDASTLSPATNFEATSNTTVFTKHEEISTPNYDRWEEPMFVEYESTEILIHHQDVDKIATPNYDRSKEEIILEEQPTPTSTSSALQHKQQQSPNYDHFEEDTMFEEPKIKKIVVVNTPGKNQSFCSESNCYNIVLVKGYCENHVKNDICTEINCINQNDVDFIFMVIRSEIVLKENTDKIPASVLYCATYGEAELETDHIFAFTKSKDVWNSAHVLYNKSIEQTPEQIKQKNPGITKTSTGCRCIIQLKKQGKALINVYPIPIYAAADIIFHFKSYARMLTDASFTAHTEKSITLLKQHHTFIEDVIIEALKDDMQEQHFNKILIHSQHFSSLLKSGKPMKKLFNWSIIIN